MTDKFFGDISRPKKCAVYVPGRSLVEVIKNVWGIFHHTISVDSKKSRSREMLPTNNNNKRALARMWEGYNNKSNRPMWLEFRSSKWLIGWTAAVAAFTVCAFCHIFFVNFCWEGADMLMSYLSIGWLYLFIRMFCCLIMMSFGSCLPIQNTVYLGRSSSTIFTSREIRSFRGSW